MDITERRPAISVTLRKPLPATRGEAPTEAALFVERAARQSVRNLRTGAWSCDAIGAMLAAHANATLSALYLNPPTVWWCARGSRLQVGGRQGCRALQRSASSAGGKGRVGSGANLLESRSRRAFAAERHSGHDYSASTRL